MKISELEHWLYIQWSLGIMMFWLYIFLSPGHLEKSTEVVTDEIIWCVEFASK